LPSLPRLEMESSMAIAIELSELLRDACESFGCPSRSPP